MLLIFTSLNKNQKQMNIGEQIDSDRLNKAFPNADLTLFNPWNIT